MDALGKATTFDYPATNNAGLPESVKDARNNVTKFKWFSSGLLDEIEDPYTKKTKITYDARGQMKTVTNALNHVTTYNYFDDTQRKVEMIYPNADKITYKYDVRRLLESVTDERGKVTNYEFDPQYRIKKVTDPLGHAKEFGYDLMSNMTSYKDPLGNETNYAFDDFNRLKKIVHPAAVSGGTRLEEEFEYDKTGRIKKYFDTADRLTEYTYNDTTRTNTVKNAENEITTTKYNQRFQTIEVKDAINQVYTFGYDPLGRLLNQTRAGGTMSFQYDEVGNRKKRTDYAGRVTNYTHDNLNRLTKIEYDLDPLNLVDKLKSEYSYDDLSRLTSAVNEAGTVTFNYDNRNRVNNTTDVFGRLIEYEYERTPTVNQKRLKFDGTMYAAYNFDDVGRLASLVNSSDSTTTTFAYDNEDKITSRVFPNGVTTTYEYYNNDLLKRLKDASTSAVLFDRQYAYNTANQIDSITELTGTKIFGYDPVDRLKTVHTNGTQTEFYNYDDVGNRASSHLSATYGYQSGKFNQLASTATATYRFDANGNTVQKSEGSNLWRYTWDYENRLTEASTRKNKVRYRYDALGRRVERSLNQGKERTKYTLDGLDVLVDNDAGTLTKYLNGPGIDNKFRSQTGTTVNYFLTDHLGSTNGLTDATGVSTASAAYDSFGNATNSGFPNRYQFTGREFDAFSAMQFSRARFYDPKLGRFISEDPIGFGGGINTYAYVGNRPTMFADPTGLFPSWWKFNYHAEIVRHGLQGLASPAQIEAIADENTKYDERTQDTIYAPYHSMRRPGQSPEDARDEANDFVRRKICEARQYAAHGREGEAMKSLGAATHTVQDNFSPAHSGFKPAWPNTWFFNSSAWPHYLWETLVPGRGNLDNAERATADVWRFYKGAPMPNDFFGKPTR